jgi:hypothetical protein
MRITSRLVFLLLTMGATSATSAAAQTPLKVEPDPQNVVASRLEGTWEPDAPLTTHLGGRQTAGEVAQAAASAVSFKSDPSIAGKIPQAMADRIRSMPGMRVYMAGTMTLSGKEYPFLLLPLSGNLQVVMFQPRGGDPMGDSESFIVQLASAREPANDVLLIGGDFNNEPFSAYKRTGTKGIGGSMPGGTPPR